MRPITNRHFHSGDQCVNLYMRMNNASGTVS